MAEAKKEKLAAGDSVTVVTAKGEHLAAEIVKAGKDGLVDLKFTHNGKEVLITSSPNDPLGKLSDSWH